MTSTFQGPGDGKPGPVAAPAAPAGADPQSVAPTTDPVPAPGELHLKERRTWKTWQLVTGMLVAALVGMALNYNASSAKSSSSSTKAYTLPPPAASGGAAPTTTTPSTTLPPGSTKSSAARSRSTARSGSSGASASGRGSATTTTTAPSTTTTAAASTSTTVAPSTGPIQILVPATQLHGNWTSPTFTITAPPWNIGWAFQCTPAPASGPSFQVFVAPVGGKPSATPAVNESDPSGRQVTQVSSTGSQVIMVQAPAGCVWAVKVTGH